MRAEKTFADAPVKAGDIIKNLKVESLGEKGDGIAKIKGFTIIILGGKEGLHYNVKITRVMSKYAFAEVIV